MKKIRIGLGIAELVMLIAACLFLVPFLNVLLASFKPSSEVFDALHFPSSWEFAHYGAILGEGRFAQSLFNTVVITSLSLGLVVLFTSMAGYAIGRSGKGLFQIVFFILISGMIIPLQSTIIPIFKLATAISLINTRTLMILLYTAGAIPFATIIYTGFVKGIPSEMEEAAAMEGCGKTRTFFTIIFPLLLPATGTVIVTNVFTIWNDFFGPLIYLYSPGKQTLMTLIYQFKQERTTDWGPIFALSVIATIPLILLFFFVQDKFLKGLTAGAVKG
ncbi:carbohydrate ABC transporter permease [Cohnella rhizosphaerae]|uniref:Carbohydrate ABC transporter permease n=1 Tax=Cohnella rhizosphaerae TaxID=1457232 RepID=A0A9X4KVE0_9BACL|nr:carbohydrate ABC transporter permease [Cohnella rhizosphaerae]MDG0811006.1 carbohydrate ABC transporter permease [Cohnella rhizosphaerae]